MRLIDAFERRILFDSESCEKRDDKLAANENVDHWGYKRLFCPNCGVQYIKGQRFCVNCGYKLI